MMHTKKEKFDRKLKKEISSQTVKKAAAMQKKIKKMANTKIKNDVRRSSQHKEHAWYPNLFLTRKHECYGRP